MTLYGASSSNSVEFGPTMPTALRANSIVAHCMPSAILDLWTQAPQERCVGYPDECGFTVRWGARPSRRSTSRCTSGILAGLRPGPTRCTFRDTPSSDCAQHSHEQLASASHNHLPACAAALAAQ